MNKEFLTTIEAARWMGIGTSTLERLRTEGHGPRFHKLGAKTIRYRVVDLVEWAKPALSTSQTRQTA